MKKSKIFYALFCSIAVLGFQSCLDYDIPSDEFSQTEIKTDDTIYQGEADNIDYTKEITKEGLEEAIQALTTPLRQAKGGQYALRRERRKLACIAFLPKAIYHGTRQLCPICHDSSL